MFFKWRGPPLVMALSFITLGLTASEAWSCSVDVCERTRGFVIPDAGVVPANLPALQWYAVAEAYGLVMKADDFQLWRYRAEGGLEHVPVEVRSIGNYEGLGVFEIVPTEGLQPWSTYRVRAPLAGCSGHDGAKTLDTEFSTAASAPLPARLGRLRLGPLLRRELALETPGRCTADYDVAMRSVEVELDESVKPWKDVLLWQTRVDEVPWMGRASSADFHSPGASWMGPGRDRIYRRCDQGHGDAAEGWSVEMSAMIPGVDLILATDSVETLMFCPEALSSAELHPLASSLEVPSGSCTGGQGGLATMLFLWMSFASFRRQAYCRRAQG